MFVRVRSTPDSSRKSVQIVNFCTEWRQSQTEAVRFALIHAQVSIVKDFRNNRYEISSQGTQDNQKIFSGDWKEIFHSTI